LGVGANFLFNAAERMERYVDDFGQEYFQDNCNEWNKKYLDIIVAKKNHNKRLHEDSGHCVARTCDP